MGKPGLACVPGVVEMLHTGVLFAVSVSVKKVNWMSAALNWHVSEVLLSC